MLPEVIIVTKVDDDKSCCKFFQGGISMSKKETITLTPNELKLLLEAMEDEEFIMSIPLLLEDLDKEDFDAEKEAL